MRTAFLRSLMRNLINEGRITTTLARAKEIRQLVEKARTLPRCHSRVSGDLVFDFRNVILASGFPPARE